MIIKLLELLNRYMQRRILLHDNTIFLFILFFYDLYNINQSLYTMNLKLQLSIFKYSNNYNCTRTIFGSRFGHRRDTILLFYYYLLYHLFHTFSIRVKIIGINYSSI